MVDELGQLEKEFAPLRPKQDRIEALRKIIRTLYDAKPADHPFTAEGARFSLLIGPRANERKVNLTKLVKAIGTRLFLQLATITLKAVESNCSPEIIANVVTLEPNTGHRPIKTFEKGSA